MGKRAIGAMLTVLAAAVLVLLSELADSLHSGTQPARPSTGSLGRRVEQELKRSRALVQEFLKSTEDSSNSGVFEQGIRFEAGTLAPRGLELFIFSEDTLSFWTSKMDLSGLRRDTSRVTLQKLQSSYYFAQWVDGGNKKALVLSFFYSDYSYQNKYLRNAFASRYRGLDGYRVSLVQAHNAIPVRPNGVSEFYLVPIDDFRNGAAAVWRPAAQWVGFALLVAAIFLLFGADYFRQRPLLRVLGLIGAVAALRGVGIYLGFPAGADGMLFGPKLFAHSSLSPSLGDFLVNAALVFACSVFASRSIPGAAQLSAGRARAMAVLTAPVVVGAYLWVDRMFAALVLHSTLSLEAYRIFNLSIYSAIGYFAIALWVASAILATGVWFRVFFDRVKLRWALGALVAGLLAVLVFSVLTGAMPTLFGFAWMLVVLAVFAVRGVRGSSTLSLRGFLVTLGGLSLYSVVLVSHFSFQKEEDVRKVLAISLSSERDPVAEVLFAPLYRKLLADTLVKHYISDIDRYNVELYTHLRKTYFKNYLNRYELRATVCLPTSQVTVDAGNSVGCGSFFSNLIGRYGMLIPASRFFYLNLQKGSISYIGEVEYRVGDELRSLYIELDSRPSWELLGYPELLIEGRGPQAALKGYSWAKYHRGMLVTQAGDFPYRLRLERSSAVYRTVNYKMHHHLIYRPNSEDAVVISRPREQVLNTTASFAYNLMFFFAVLLLLLRWSGLPVQVRVSGSSFKNRISWAISLIIVLSMLMVAAATILYNIKSFNQRNEKNLSEKLLSVMFELDRDIMLIYRPNIYDLERLSDRLIELSNIFYTDINIYNTSGMLMVTSRVEMFEKQLLGPRMSHLAWFQMAHQHSPKFVDSERIGGMSFLSAYVPILGSDGETIAYLNLPYFTKQEELRSELYSVVVAIINIYALLALLAIAVAVLISAQITRPLELIRERIGTVDIAGNNEPIEYSGRDEVGQLIREYNRMVQELAWSAKELARNQRESAWREMAKQVAHEVKNPLTPIKLSLQHLVKAKKEGVADWDRRFEKFSESLVEQVNALSSIANEFSSFAKLPSASIGRVNLHKLLAEITVLYSGYRSMSVGLTNGLPYEPTVMADREQLLRVFNNLVKNAIQSVGRGRQGVIGIGILPGEAGLVRVEVRDNGSGIPDDVLPKLFTPNFTTKSGGTGLGLAIAREIVVGFGGTVRVSTQLGVGSTFTVELPEDRE